MSKYCSTCGYHAFEGESCECGCTTNYYEVQCEVCGKTVSNDEIIIDEDNGLFFCSKICQEMWHLKRKKVRCKFCGDFVELSEVVRFDNKNFCSNPCKMRWIERQISWLQDVLKCELEEE